MAPGDESLVEDGPEHAKTIAERTQVADSVDPGTLEARNFDNRKIGRCDTDVNQRFDLKAISP
jgi:hypothetical protein